MKKIGSQAPAPTEIVAAREAALLTQTQAAAVVHSSLRTWQQWEAGDRHMQAGLWELFRLKTARRKGTRTTIRQTPDEVTARATKRKARWPMPPR